MNIPLKYEDVVAKLEAALGREAALREELDKAVWELVDVRDLSLKFEKSLKTICQPIIEDSRRTLIIKDELDILAGHMGENGDEGYSIVMGATHEISRLVKFNSELQQRLTVAERRESEAREELLDLSRKLDVFYSRSHGIKNLSAIEDANDKSKALQQRLTVAEHREEDLKKLLCDVINEAATGFAALKVDLANRVNDALKPAAEGEGS